MWLRYFLLAIGWVLTGMVLGIPYNWLANGTGGNLARLIVLTPPISLGLLIILIIARHYPFKEDRRKLFIMFWSVLGFFSLPIILRFASIGVKVLGYIKTADFIFKYRYESMAMVFGIALFALFVEGWTEELIKKIKSKKPEIQED